MLNVVKRLIPRPVKRKIRNYLENRYKARLFGDLAPLVPAVEDMFDGPQSLEEFKANGEEFFRIYKEICGLQPDEKMLDVGSGIGRKTFPLTRYLNDRAVYEGIDITKAGVDWCREKITLRCPNFHFQQIDVYNKCYNPLGKYQASEYKFSFARESFSFVMLGSVFTHMLPRDVENYLSEVYRVLTKSGRCLISYFLLNEESLRLIGANESTLDLKYVFDEYRTISRDVPELAIALDERLIRGMYSKLGLKIMRLDYGSWCGRANYLSYQDLILAVKE
jgi:ubiquinone/menaquinone biosynthesis C-methylase UbiE